MTRLTWRFSALDSWFFRESRPFDSVGGSELGSVFPPSPATLAGAIRTAIGDKHGVAWKNYPAGYPDLQQQIGDNNTLGKLRITGVFLSRQTDGGWERLYPVPAHLVATLDATKEKDRIKSLHFLQVGPAVRCDLGEHVRLAVAPAKGIKPLDNYWLTQTGLVEVLAGRIPGTGDLIESKDLFAAEARLGIARDNRQRTVEQSMLYQTRHIRPNGNLAVEIDIDGLEAASYPESGIVRLGGEGRGAYFSVFTATAPLPEAPSAAGAIGLKLQLISAAPMPQQTAYAPLPGFTQNPQANPTVWTGTVNGIALTLHCAITGKALREGGWDLIGKKPKPVRSFIPAGSVFYCTADGDINNAIDALKTGQLDGLSPLDTALGRGLFIVSPWFQHDTAHKEPQS